MDILEKDLGALEIRKTTQNYEFLRAVVSNVSNSPVPNDASTSLLFLTSPVDSSNGAVQCVSYKVLYKNPLSSRDGGRVFGLYRGKMTARATLANGYVIKTQPSDPGLSNVFNNPSTGDDTPDETAATDPESSANLLVSNVLALRIIPYYYDTTSGNIVPLEGTQDEPKQLLSGTFVIDAKNGASIIGGVTDKKIAYIDVVMILLTQEGSAFLKAMDANNIDTPSDWGVWLSQNTYTFSRRVPIQGQL